MGSYPDVLAVPIQAITSFGHKKFVFVKNADNEFESREVELGESNTSFTAIESGVEAGEVVSLDAYQRGLREFEEEPEEDDDGEALLAEMAAKAELDKSDEPPTPRKLESEDGETGDEDESEDESEDEAKDEADDKTEDDAEVKDETEEAQPAEGSDSTSEQTQFTPKQIKWQHMVRALSLIHI